MRESGVIWAEKHWEAVRETTPNWEMPGKAKGREEKGMEKEPSSFLSELNFLMGKTMSKMGLMGRLCTISMSPAVGKMLWFGGNTHIPFPWGWSSMVLCIPNPEHPSASLYLVPWSCSRRRIAEGLPGRILEPWEG